jgi:hypothetical protein
MVFFFKAYFGGPKFYHYLRNILPFSRNRFGPTGPDRPKNAIFFGGPQKIWSPEIRRIRQISPKNHKKSRFRWNCDFWSIYAHNFWNHARAICIARDRLGISRTGIGLGMVRRISLLEDLVWAAGSFF